MNKEDAETLKRFYDYFGKNGRWVKFTVHMFGKFCPSAMKCIFYIARRGKSGLHSFYFTDKVYYVEDYEWRGGGCYEFNEVYVRGNSPEDFVKSFEDAEKVGKIMLKELEEIMNDGDSEM